MRMDIIPVSIAIAQAANESGWGTSRFALEGNAYLASGHGVKKVFLQKIKILIQSPQNFAISNS